MTNYTREHWCKQAADLIMNDLILPEVQQHSITLPHTELQYRICVGYPRGHRPSKNGAMVLGVCHPRSHSTDNTNEMFLSPEVDDPVKMLATIAHENVHAALDCEDGHKGRFAQLARAIGLTGKMTETYPSADLAEALEYIATQLPEYPASKMLPKNHKPKQGTRMIKVHCPSCTEFTARASNKVVTAWLAGDGNCPVCTSGRLVFDV